MYVERNFKIQCVGLSQDHPFVCCTSFHIFLVLQVNSYSGLHADTNKHFCTVFLIHTVS